jgi:hypothetical protein
MKFDPRFRFRLAAFMTMLSALLVGYFNVGSLYLFGLPLVPFAISLLILWTTKTSILRKASATIIALLFIPGGFFLFVWWNNVSVIWNR